MTDRLHLALLSEAAPAFLRRVLVAVILGLAVIGAWGCSGSALDRHVTAAQVVGVSLDATAGGIEIACAEPQIDAHPSRLDPCLSAVQWHEASRAAWGVWTRALILAGDDPTVLDAALELARPLLTLYQAGQPIAASLGLVLPDPPALLLTLGGLR